MLNIFCYYLVGYFSEVLYVRKRFVDYQVNQLKEKKKNVRLKFD